MTKFKHLLPLSVVIFGFTVVRCSPWPVSFLAFWGAEAPLDRCARDRQGVPFGTSGIVLCKTEAVGGSFGGGVPGVGMGGFIPPESAHPADTILAATFLFCLLYTSPSPRD